MRIESNLVSGLANETVKQDGSARAIQPKSQPSNAGTEHLALAWLPRRRSN
jgi:hypothetical protein